MMSERFTLDTNILVYALDSQAGDKHAVASDIVRRSARLDCVLTLQSVVEFYRAVTRKGIVRHSEAAAQANDWLDLFQTISYDQSAVRAALAEAVAGRFSFFDALMLATASSANCRLILSEDMQDGMSYRTLRIRNPFTATGLPPDLTPLPGEN